MELVPRMVMDKNLLVGKLWRPLCDRQRGCSFGWSTVSFHILTFREKSETLKGSDSYPSLDPHSSAPQDTIFNRISHKDPSCFPSDTL